MTPRGRGAVGTICFEGDCTLLDNAAPQLFRAVNGKTLAEQEFDHVVFGHWGSDETQEEVVVCRVDDESLEIHCHGGDAAVDRILKDLESIGCRIHSWQEMQEEDLGTFDAECLDALTRSTTSRAAAILLEQQKGLLKREIDVILSEHTLRSAMQSPLEQLLSWSDFGLHLTRPWNVVLAGKPNVGKSSLINALVGYARSIIHDEPGTTRDVVTAETAFDGWPVQLADTAGIRDAAEQLESAGIDRAKKMLSDADCRILLVDVSLPPDDEDRRMLSDWPNAIIVAHKSDLPSVWSKSDLPAGVITVSSITGDGVDKLAEAIVSRLVPVVPEAGTPIPVTERQVLLLKQALASMKTDDFDNCAAALKECLK